MDSLHITGPTTLSGDITVAGAKNAALKLIAASLLSDQTWTIRNVPDIKDIGVLLDIITELGCTVSRDGSTVTINAGSITSSSPDPALVRKLRASIVLTGPLVGRVGSVRLPHPGGCIIGKRPIDIFLDGFAALGVSAVADDEAYTITKGETEDTTFVFPRITVSGTETLVMLATMLPGKHRFVNVALEPEVLQLLETLVRAGATIDGIGTPILTVTGQMKPLADVDVSVIPDRLEAGTFMIMAAATGSSLTVHACRSDHLEVPIALLRKAGVTITHDATSITVHHAEKLIATSMTTHEYPGFITDLQAPYTVLMTQAQGVSLIHETIYEGRLFFIDKLNKMGADILLADPHRAVVNGPTKLHRTKMESPDIRAGIALVIAAMIADGESRIDNAYQIDRGYERIDERLRSIGANVTRHDHDDD